MEGWLVRRAGGDVGRFRAGAGATLVEIMDGSVAVRLSGRGGKTR